MKKVIYLVLILGIISCSTDETAIRNADLVGKWNWIGTDGGFDFHIHESPETTGKIIHLVLTEDHEFSVTENGNEISNGTYELSFQKSIYSGEIERFIALKTTDQQNVGFVQKGIVNVEQNDKLEISDNNPDGVGSGFVKME